MAAERRIHALEGEAECILLLRVPLPWIFQWALVTRLALAFPPMVYMEVWRTVVISERGCDVDQALSLVASFCLENPHLALNSKVGFVEDRVLQLAPYSRQRYECVLRQSNILIFGRGRSVLGFDGCTCRV